MPSTGFYLFLLRYECLCHLRCTVSMPSTGFYLFLRYLKAKQSKANKLCQCPQRASTYFFGNTIKQRRRIWECVNALNGLLLISSIINFIEHYKKLVCQCPQRASTYFFHIMMIKIKQEFLCQCPQRASTYFFLL